MAELTNLTSDLRIVLLPQPTGKWKWELQEWHPSKEDPCKGFWRTYSQAWWFAEGEKRKREQALAAAIEAASIAYRHRLTDAFFGHAGLQRETFEL